ncbi:MAG TPA: hypothetical protein VMV46_05045 [Thermoanaerobaculia bacterium]|nr:hypothetical protein [Thermoanaerobaculia bacterium]
MSRLELIPGKPPPCPTMPWPLFTNDTLHLGSRFELVLGLRRVAVMLESVESCARGPVQHFGHGIFPVDG